MSVMPVLRECHRLRIHIRDLQTEIDRGPRVLAEHQEELDAERQAHQGHYDAITKLKLKQREDEGTLKQTDGRLAKLEAQLTGLTAPKEYAAKEVEIAHAKDIKAKLEDAIFATITELEERTAAIPAVEDKWKAAQAAFAQYQAEAAERLAALLADQEASRAKLAAAEAKLTPDAKPTYDNVVRARGPDALTAVKNRVCQVCRSTMAEQQFADLRKGQFRTCVTCGRVMYPVE
jgi:predicted  nucleic acid-binding Zn-ribbon protein